MKFRVMGLLVLVCAFAIIVWNKPETTHSQTKKTAATLSQAEQDLLKEINQARANPQIYAGYFEELKPRFKGKQYTTERSTWKLRKVGAPLKTQSALCGRQNPQVP